MHKILTMIVAGFISTGAVFGTSVQETKGPDASGMCESPESREEWKKTWKEMNKAKYDALSPAEQTALWQKIEERRGKGGHCRGGMEPIGPQDKETLNKALCMNIKHNEMVISRLGNFPSIVDKYRELSAFLEAERARMCPGLSCPEGGHGHHGHHHGGGKK